MHKTRIFLVFIFIELFNHIYDRGRPLTLILFLNDLPEIKEQVFFESISLWQIEGQMFP